MKSRMLRIARAALPILWCVMTNPTAVKAEALVADHNTIDTEDRVIPQSWLNEARNLRVYFGHQSVGANLLEGLEALGRQLPVRYRLVIRAQPSRFNPVALFEGDAASPLRRGGIEHFMVGRNGDPAGKLRDFAQRMNSRGHQADIAMMKFCYVDTQDANANAARLFASYRDGMEQLQESYPNLRLIWWTVPLTRGDNHFRTEYNRLVRSYAASKGVPLFDIADIESHDPGGHEITESGEPALYTGYTQDGGHLTREGELRAARAWWWLSARMAGWAGSRAN